MNPKARRGCKNADIAGSGSLKWEKGSGMNMKQGWPKTATSSVTSYCSLLRQQISKGEAGAEVWGQDKQGTSKTEIYKMR